MFLIAARIAGASLLVLIPVATAWVLESDFRLAEVVDFGAVELTCRFRVIRDICGGIVRVAPRTF